VDNFGSFWGAFSDSLLGHSNTLNQVEQALLNLEHAEKNGLRSEDYGNDTLRRAWNQLLCQRHSSFEDYSRFDLALSISVLHYLSDIRFGRIEPTEISFDLKHPQQLDKLVSLILSATEQNNVENLTALAEPRYPPYQRLKQVLKHYRQLEKQPMPFLLFSHSIEPGDKNPNIIHLKDKLQILGFLEKCPQWRAESNSCTQIESDQLHLQNEQNVSDYHADRENLNKDTLIEQPQASTEILSPTVAEDLYAGAVVDAVKQFQRQHGLAADGVIGSKTLEALNTPIRQRITQLELAMEHWRWLPPLKQELPLILVNIPAYHLWVYQNSDLSQPAKLDMKVIVGMAKENQTPVFMGRLQYLEFGPYWNIPWKIAVKEILPKIQQDPGYLAKHNMELVADFHINTQVLSSTESLADDLVSGRVHIRQRPGAGNALGKIKFIFPNRHAVYLHDTPSRRLFYKSRRDLSHGCVRVEQPKQLAEYILTSANDWREKDVILALRKKKNRRVRVKQSFQVLLFYNTADIIDGKTYFYPDIYRLDSQLVDRLQQYSQYVAQTLDRQLAAFLSPVSDIPGIKVNKTARIIADAAAP